MNSDRPPNPDCENERVKADAAAHVLAVAAAEASMLVRRERFRIEGLIDVFTVAVFGVLLYTKTVTDPAQVWALLGMMGTIAGVGGWMKNKNIQGSATLLLLSPALKYATKAAIAVHLMRG